MSAAIIERSQEQKVFRDEVWGPWKAEHPTVGLAYERARMSTNLVVLGFLPGSGKPPVGLSMSLKKGYASPTHGRRGEPWREDLVRLNAQPSMDEVFARFDVPTGAWLDTQVYEMVLEPSPEGVVYLECEANMFGAFTGIVMPDAVRRVAVEELDAVRESNRALREAARR